MQTINITVKSIASGQQDTLYAAEAVGDGWKMDGLGSSPDEALGNLIRECWLADTFNDLVKLAFDFQTETLERWTDFATSQEVCPQCKSENISNEDGPDDHNRLPVTCLDCGFQWTEPDTPIPEPNMETVEKALKEAESGKGRTIDQILDEMGPEEPKARNLDQIFFENEEPND